MNAAKINNKLDEVLAHVVESSNNQKQIFNVLEAAKYLSLSPAYLYRLTCRRLIAHYKPGKKIYFKKDDLDAWMLRNKKESIEVIAKNATEYLSRKNKKK
jgi:excisionase family DNA binding protein